MTRIKRLLEQNIPLKEIFEFNSYKECLEFINNVAKISERCNHHPKITWDYLRITIESITHETGEVGEKDYNLIDHINKLRFS